MCAQMLHFVRRTESQITEDHLRIRALLDGIKAVGDPHVLLPLLRELNDTLDGHFALEEGDDGLYAMAAEYSPARVDRVEELLDEHRHLLAAVHALIQKCNKCIAGPLTEIRDDVHTLFGTIQNHDAAETEILTEVLLKAMQGEPGESK